MLKKDRLGDCRMCEKNKPLRNNACETRVPTVQCNPNEPQYWVSNHSCLKDLTQFLIIYTMDVG